MTTYLQNNQQSVIDVRQVDYSPDLVPRSDMNIVVRELSMLSHDGWGGMTIIGKLLDAGACVHLAEYDMRLDPADRFSRIKASGPCMSTMILREAEDRRNDPKSQ